jgi:4-amino-4-deoxy-L-arabinose transferase-like glycosyltransferase
MASSSTSGDGATSRWIAFALGVLLLWAGALRVWMASSGLESGHYWDERYSIKNVRAILEGGTLEPANYYYPSLSYLPQAAVLAGVEGVARLLGNESFSFFAGGGFHPWGYLIARLIQVVYALGTLALTFLLGRRLISAPAGLIAALLLAVAPQHVRLSTMWKPDVTLLLAILLTLWWSLDALDRPTLRRYLLAGVGVGLALAAKLNGGPIAAPLAIGAAVAGINDRRHWRGLIAAGIAAAVVFVALNPQVSRYLTALERNQELYSRQVRGPDPSLPQRLVQVVREEVGFVLSFNFHGAWIGVAALAGLGAIAWLALRRRDRRSLQLALAVLVFPLAYTLLYAASTAFAKENNFLQILPFTALAAAFALAAVASRFGAPLAERWRRPAAAIAIAALAVVVAAPTQAWVYRTQVPDTWELALADVTERLRPWDGRVAWVEAPREELGAVIRRTKGLVRPVDDLAAVAIDLLDQADAEVFTAVRLEGDDEFHRQRTARVDATAIARFAPRWFAARGPTVIAVLHPRQPVGSWTVTAVATSAGAYHLEMPASVEGEWLSAEVLGGRSRAGHAEPEIVVDDRPLRLHPRSGGPRAGWLSERFPAGSRSLSARVPPLGAADAGDLVVRIYGWR